MRTNKYVGTPKYRSAVSRAAAQQTFEGLRRKVPFFVVIAFACAGLYVLDSAKSKYDAAQKAPVVVDQDFVGIAASRLPADARDVLRDINKLSYSSFKDGAEFTGALGQVVDSEYARRVRDLDAREETARKLHDEKVMRYDKEEFEIKALGDLDGGSRAVRFESLRKKFADDRGLPVSRFAAEEDLLSQLKADRELAKKEHDDSQKRVTPQRLALNAEIEGRKRRIYQDFSQSLPTIVTEYKKRKAPDGFFDGPLRLTLDETSSLNVIYQIFKVASMVILVLTLIAIIALVMRALLSPESAGAFTEQASRLVSFTPGSSAGNITRMAIASVAALGVGTAAVVTGSSINDKASRALETANAAASEVRGTSPHARPTFLTPAGGKGPRACCYLPNAGGAVPAGGGNGDGGDVNINEQDGPAPTASPNIIVNPSTANIEAPPVIVRLVPFPAGGGRSPDLRQLSLSLSALSSNVTKLQGEVQNLNTEGLNTLRTETVQKLGAIEGRLDNVSGLNATLGTIGRSLQNISTATTDGHAVQGTNLQGVNATLRELGGKIETLHNDYLAGPPASGGRNLATRTKQLFGSERFLVSEQAYRALENLIADKGHPVLKSLAEIKAAREPLTKSQFRKKLKQPADAATRALLEDKAMREFLKKWEPVIFSYTRTPR